jgi:hypothetical protein
VEAQSNIKHSTSNMIIIVIIKTVVAKGMHTITHTQTEGAFVHQSIGTDARIGSPAGMRGHPGRVMLGQQRMVQIETLNVLQPCRDWRQLHEIAAQYELDPPHWWNFGMVTVSAADVRAAECCPTRYPDQITTKSGPNQDQIRTKSRSQSLSGAQIKVGLRDPNKALF